VLKRIQILRRLLLPLQELLLLMIRRKCKLSGLFFDFYRFFPGPGKVKLNTKTPLSKRKKKGCCK
jgi:hypothetical protein